MPRPTRVRSTKARAQKSIAGKPLITIAINRSEREDLFVTTLKSQALKQVGENDSGRIRVVYNRKHNYYNEAMFHDKSQLKRVADEFLEPALLREWL